jgi:excisionase family DNA binding protein
MIGRVSHVWPNEILHVGNNARLVVQNWVTIDEIAIALRVSKTYVYRLVEGGELPGTVRVGRLLRIPVDGFYAFLKRNALSASGSFEEFVMTVDDAEEFQQ